MIRDELSDEYFATIADQLEYLRFRSGVVTGAELGPGNKGARYTLRRTRARRGLRGRVGDWRRGSRSSFEVAPRDDAGLQTLTEIRGQALGPAANALARSADHVFGFFTALRGELAFYVACLNLYEGLARKGEPTCVPEPAPRGERSMSARGLYDICLSMHLEGRAVGNDLEVEDALLVVITGANQGGKSTMLRSVGLAQLLMQCGMRVPAIAFTADVREGIFTHFKREEDATMQSGKLDEELQRMSEIVDAIGPHSILLCNESFAATNEREGSELARQLVQALVGVGIKVFFVTHLFDLADGLHRQQMGVFLRAERLEDGSRTFRVVPGAPLPTSHGRDLFDRILGSEEHPLYARTLDE